MSINRMEGYIDNAVNTVIHSSLSDSEKRNLIYTLFEIGSYGDSGAINMQLVDGLIECQYTFLFDKSEMFDYVQRPDFYDNPESEHNHSEPYHYTAAGEHYGKICVDSGSKCWSEMVRLGKIVGSGTEPVVLLDFLDTIKRTLPLLEPLSPGLRREMRLLADFSGAIDNATSDDLFLLMGIDQDDISSIVE